MSCFVRADAAAAAFVAALSAVTLAPAAAFAQTAKSSTPVPMPMAAQAGQAGKAAPVSLQGFSVILVLGDLQGTSTADDVPMAARKALTDMRDFLPYKSYRLLDAAWMMCCGASSGADSARYTAQHPSVRSASTMMSTQMLKGQDDVEYELKMMSSRADQGRVFVRFTLVPPRSQAESPEVSHARLRREQQIANLTDRREVLAKEIAAMRARVEVGVTSGADLAKLELELRTLDREIAVFRRTPASSSSASQSSARATAEAPRVPIIDTNFTMDVGETVVVGTSRLRSGSRALIALLTAVPDKSAAR